MSPLGYDPWSWWTVPVWTQSSTWSSAAEDIRASCDVFVDNDIATIATVQTVAIGMDIACTLCFIVELVMRAIGPGFFCAGERRGSAYLASRWAVADFILVAVSCVTSITVPFVDASLVRFLQIFRVFRVVTLSSRIRVAVLAFVGSLPHVAHVLAFCGLIWVIFGVVGVELYRGQFAHCCALAIVDEQSCIQAGLSWMPPRTCIIPTFATDPVACEVAGYQWSNPTPMHFDNIFTSFLCLFSISTLCGWMKILEQGFNSVLQSNVTIDTFDASLTQLIEVRRVRQGTSINHTRDAA